MKKPRAAVPAGLSGSWEEAELRQAAGHQYEKTAAIGAERFERVYAWRMWRPARRGDGGAVPVTDPAHRPDSPIFASTIPPKASSAAEASPQPILRRSRRCPTISRIACRIGAGTVLRPSTTG